MQKIIFNLISILSSITLAHCVYAQPAQAPFKQVVVWGYSLHSHTHSYIHYAYERAFKHLGYKTYWLSNKDDIRNIDFANSLFITAGNGDQNIPLRSDCRYILHNCDLSKYQKLFNDGNCIIMQVYSHDCLKRNDKKIGPCTHIDINNKTIYMPWATDLLPHEIDAMKKQVGTKQKENAVYMVGSISGGDQFENKSKHDAFRRACTQNGIRWSNPTSLSAEDNINVIQQSYIAPAIQSQWQCDNGYIPCRIFKNICYGQWGATNSRTVWELFKEGGIDIVYNANTYQLFFDTVKKAQEGSLEELCKQMDFVRDHHTYLNRIELLLWFMNEIKPLS